MKHIRDTSKHFMMELEKAAAAAFMDFEELPPCPHFPLGLFDQPKSLLKCYDHLYRTHREVLRDKSQDGDSPLKTANYNTKL